MNSVRIIFVILTTSFLIFPFTENLTSGHKINFKKKATYQTCYTTASGLKVLTKPSIKSRVLMVLPYGTRIRTRKTRYQYAYNEKRDYWYYCKESGGYVFGYYLSRKQPTGKKVFITRRLISNEICPHELETLYFSNMQVKKVLKRDCKTDVMHYVQMGTYSINKGYFAIWWKKTTLKLESQISFRNLEFNVKESWQNLYYLPDKKAWIDGESKQAIQKAKCTFVKQGCYMDCSEAYYNKFKREYSNSRFKWNNFKHHYYYHLYSY